MNALVAWAYQNRLLALLFAAALVAGGLFAASNMPIDAVPDVTNIQVQVVTRAPSLSATEVETQSDAAGRARHGGRPGLSLIRSITQIRHFDRHADLQRRAPMSTSRARRSTSACGGTRRDPRRSRRPSWDRSRPRSARSTCSSFALRAGRALPKSSARSSTGKSAPACGRCRASSRSSGSAARSSSTASRLDPARLAAHGISIADGERRPSRTDNRVGGGGYIERPASRSSSAATPATAVSRTSPQPSCARRERRSGPPRPARRCRHRARAASGRDDARRARRGRRRQRAHAEGRQQP